MRKYATYVIFVLLIGLVLWFPSKNKYEAGNVIPSYEYYYNDEDAPTEGKAMQKPTPTKAAAKAGVPETPAPTPVKSGEPELDLRADSLSVFINKEHSLPADYVPERLTIPAVLFNFSQVEEKRYLRKEASTALEALFAASKKEGLSLYAVSGYRSYKRQTEIYSKNLQQRGALATNAVSAVPGYSEHQSGLAMDVSCPSINFRLSEAFAGTPEGLWLAKNAHKFGFIIRYPKGKSHLTGYSYEPWHIRYLGEDLAKLLYKNSLTLEEYYGYKPKKNLLNESGSDRIVDVDEGGDAHSVAAPAPKKTARPTPQPTKEPEPTKVPKKTPKPTQAPKKTEKPEKTKQTQKPTQTPTQTPVPHTPEPSVPPSSSAPPTDIQEPVPNEVDGVTGGEQVQ